MLISDLCDHRDIYFVVKGKITVAGANDDKTTTTKKSFKIMIHLYHGYKK